MYVTAFSEFVEEAERLFTADPAHTRYSVKYRHCDGRLVLKVTDNRTVVSYKTKDVADLPMVGKLTATFLNQCTGVSPEAVASELLAQEKEEARHHAQPQHAKKQQQPTAHGECPFLLRNTAIQRRQASTGINVEATAGQDQQQNEERKETAASRDAANAESSATDGG